MSLSPDGHRLAAATYEGFIHLWSLATGQEVARFGEPGKDPLSGPEFLQPDGSTLVTFTPVGAKFWRAPSWGQIDAAERTR
jgi:hypothetical protein